MHTTNLKQITDTIINSGLTTYKPQNKLFATETTPNKKDVVFLVRNKYDFSHQSVKGFIVTSKETIIEQLNYVSHWTPNVYCYGKYTDATRTHIKGFSETNLKQINTFVFETDNKDLSVNEILLNCQDSGIGVPTMIVESDRGYHIYFALETPVYLNANNLNKVKEIKVLAAAKRIAKNLKEKLNEFINIDLNCNSFGFFRAPNKTNVAWFSKEMTYSFKHLMNLSMDFEADKYVSKAENVQFIKNKYAQKFLDWLTPLRDNLFIKGEKGQIGRNNLFFTIALAFKATKRSFEDAYDFIDQLNTNLRYPLNDAEVKRTVKSAFDGKCKGPSNQYIQNLIETYGDKTDYKKYLIKGWYKHKKARNERVRSHYDEIEGDIIDYLKTQCKDGEAFIWRTQKQICETLKIASSTLNEVLKKKKNLIKIVIGKGRGAKTGWTTFAIILNAIRLKKANYKSYIQSLQQVFAIAEMDEDLTYIATLIQHLKDTENYINNQQQSFGKQYKEWLNVANK